MPSEKGGHICGKNGGGGGIIAEITALKNELNRALFLTAVPLQVQVDRIWPYTACLATVHCGSWGMLVTMSPLLLFFLLVATIQME